MVKIEKENKSIGNHDLFSWGTGKRGAFGDGHYENYKTPHLNETIKEIREHDGIKVKTLKSRNHSTLALFGKIFILY